MQRHFNRRNKKTIKEVNVSHVTTTIIITRSFPLTLLVPPNVIPSHHFLHSSQCSNNASTTYIHTSIVQTFEIKSHRMNTRWENVRAGRTFKRTNSVAWNCHLNHIHAQTLSHIYERTHTQPNSHTRSSQVYPWYSHVCLLVLYPFEANVTMCLRALVCVSVCENVCVCTQVNKLEYLKYLSAGIGTVVQNRWNRKRKLKLEWEIYKVEVRFIESIGQFVLSGVTQRSPQLWWLRHIFFIYSYWKVSQYF